MNVSCKILVDRHAHARDRMKWVLSIALVVRTKPGYINVYALISGKL